MAVDEREWLRIRQAALGIVLVLGLILATWGLAMFLEDMSSHDDWLDGLGAFLGAIAMGIGLIVSGVCGCGLIWPTQTWKALGWTLRIVVLPLAALQIAVLVLRAVLA